MKKLRIRWTALWARYGGVMIGFAVLGAFFLLRFALGLPCPIRYLTGIACPGCGMTRALWSLATLDPAAAWHYHPACFGLLALAPPLLWCHHTGKRKGTAALLSLLVILLLTVYLFRLLTGDRTVVTVEPQNGLIGRLLRQLLSRIRSLF